MLRLFPVSVFQLLGFRKDRSKTPERRRLSGFETLEARRLLHGAGFDAQLYDHVHPHPLPLEAEVLAADASPEFDTSISRLPGLSSNPGAPATIFLDFDGHFESAWGYNSATGDKYRNIATPVYDIDGDPATFNSVELANIRTIWEVAAEDFSPFNVNVTTVDPGDFRDGKGLRVAIGGDSSWLGLPAGGVAPDIGTFHDPRNPNTVYAFIRSPGSSGSWSGLSIGNTASHEAGHALGLYHQSDYSGTQMVDEYRDPEGDVSAIMGGGGNQFRTTWSRGPNSRGSSVIQDDMAVIAGAENGFGYRADDHGASAATATNLTASGTRLSASGIIERLDDVDYFRFWADAGPLSLRVTTPSGWIGNLDTVAELRSGDGSQLLFTSNPGDSFGASIDVTVAAGGWHTLVVQGDRSRYGSAGQYSITGTRAVAAKPDLLGASFNVVQEPRRAGESLDVEFKVKNAGAAAGTFNVKFYLSSNSAITEHDHLLGSYRISGLGANTTTAQLLKTLTLPAAGHSVYNADGTYFVGMIVDSDKEVGESNGANNGNLGEFTDYDGLQISDTAPPPPGKPDLLGDYFNVVQEPLKAGDSFDVRFRVKNAGTTAAGASTVKFYLSSNATISASDRLLGSYRIGTLSAGADTPAIAKTLAMPSAGDSFYDGDGIYFVGMIVDADREVGESDGANNGNLGEFIDFDGLQLVDTTAPPPGKPDLLGDYFNVSPEPLEAGDSFHAQFRVKNAGATTAGASTVKFYLSSNATISRSDRLLGSYRIGTLSAGADTGVLIKMLAAPSAGDSFWSGDGTYYIGVLVDAEREVAESNGSNNSSVAEWKDYDGVRITLGSPSALAIALREESQQASEPVADDAFADEDVEAVWAEWPTGAG